MALTARPVEPAIATRRLVGPDVVRAMALIGVVVMNYHGYSYEQPAGDGTVLDRFFNPWTGPLSTRFASTFVLTAGVGVTLLTRSAHGDPALVTARRWTLVRRGLVLYGGGLALDMIWPGTILPYYGAMFVLAAGLFTLRTGWVLAFGAGAALAGAGIEWWSLERRLDGQPTAWLHEPGAGPRQLVLDTFVNGTHPLLPWLAFFCTGMVLGRLLTTAWWRPLCAGVGLSLFGLAAVVSGAVTTGELAPRLVSTDPFDRGLLYVASALGTSLVAFAVVSWLAERFVRSPLVDALRHAGAMTLTLYLGHVFVFRLLIDWWGWVDPQGLGGALAFAGAYWVVAILAAWWYHRRFGIGPVEWLYRQLGA